MHIHAVTSAAHTAFCEPNSGVGILVRPLPQNDVRGLGMGLHGADWDSIVRQLHAINWEIVEDHEDGLPARVGELPDGREVVAIAANEPISTAPDLEAEGQALMYMLDLATTT